MSVRDAVALQEGADEEGHASIAAAREYHRMVGERVHGVVATCDRSPLVAEVARGLVRGHRGADDPLERRCRARRPAGSLLEARPIEFVGDRGKPGVDMVAPFGTSLHVSGRDKAALEATIVPYRDRPGLHWQRSEPSLEDVFIELMTRSKDNFQ